MAFKYTRTLTCLLFIWLNLTEVTAFVAFNEERRINSVGSFNENARAMESFDGGDSKAKSGAQVGRLIIGQSRSPNDKSDGDRLSSDARSFDRPHDDDDAYQSDDAGNFLVVIKIFLIPIYIIKAHRLKRRKTIMCQIKKKL